MKLPSIIYLLTSAKESFKRFPLTIISSLIAVVFGVYLTEYFKEMTNMLPYINIMLCLSLGIPLFFCITIVSNKKGFTKRNVFFSNLIAIGILVIIYFTLPNSESTHNISLPYIKYALYNITCHLLISFIPFVSNKQLNAFWHYNKILFIRILTSMLYSGFIYFGIIIALTSLNLLFDIKIHEQLYLEIWIVTIGFFNTWFFVSGIPSDIDCLEDVSDYPKGLKIFTQYVLLPLLGLYLIILYTYGTKILILWDWPRGVVSYLIICMSVLGILAFLLIYPYGNLKDNLWIKKVTKWYYFLLLPLLVILFIAIYMRINDYGITINRYVILILGIWLLIVCLYTALGKTNIKFIPTSLAIILILISFGPWGMFSLSEKSQVNRLKNILEQSKILVNKKIQNEPKWLKDSLPNLYSNKELRNEGKLTDSLHNEVRSILDYLDNHHGFSLIREWYIQNIDSIVSLNNSRKNLSYANNEAEIYMKTLGLNYEYIYKEYSQTVIDYNSSLSSSIVLVTGYDYLIDFNKYIYDFDDENICNFMLDNIEYNLIYLDKPKHSLSLQSEKDTLNFDLNSLLNKLKKEYGKTSKHELPISKMQFKDSLNQFEIKIEFRNIQIKLEKNNFFVKNISGDIFIKRKTN